MSTDNPSCKEPVIIYREGGGLLDRRVQVKFYPYEKGGGTEKVLAMLKDSIKSFCLVQHRSLKF